MATFRFRKRRNTQPIKEYIRRGAGLDATVDVNLDGTMSVTIPDPDPNLPSGERKAIADGDKERLRNTLEEQEWEIGGVL
ncbi:MAG: hypothetical protein HY791_02930 [Deltaproteobacteria bacterium]|nr:hypothetical protein [Deltaproteobacteria bacterium]